MKKILFLCCFLLILASCKDKTEEIKVDETKIDTPVDSIAQKDTIAVLETKVSADSEKKEINKPT